MDSFHQRSGPHGSCPVEGFSSMVVAGLLWVLVHPATFDNSVYQTWQCCAVLNLRDWAVLGLTCTLMVDALTHTGHMTPQARIAHFPCVGHCVTHSDHARPCCLCCGGVPAGPWSHVQLDTDGWLVGCSLPLLCFLTAFTQLM